MAKRIPEIRITNSDFNDQFAELVTFFRVKTVREIAERYYRRLRWYYKEALKWAVGRIIEDAKPMPGNMPTINELANFCETWLADHPDKLFAITQYDKENDPAYPISKLEVALSVLKSAGDESFMKFCEKNRMPYQDIERVMMKHKYQARIEKGLSNLPKIGENSDKDEPEQ